MNRPIRHDETNTLFEERTMKRMKTLALAALLLPLGAALAQDAESVYRDGRSALNRRNFEEAVELFTTLRREYPQSAYVSDSLYWEAFALERDGDLEGAVEAIDRLLENFPQASMLDDAQALRVQVCSDLARRGDDECAQAVAATVRNTGELDEATRMAAVNALINMRADRAVPIATQVAGNRGHSAGVRRQALFVLADKAEEAGYADQVRETLRSIALDESDDAQVRRQAVFWLSEVPGPETLEILAGIVEQARDAELRDRAIFAIAQLETPESMALLQQYALDESLGSEQRRRAIFWIASEGESAAMDFLKDLYTRLDDDDLRQQVLFALKEAGEQDAVAWLLERARDTAEPVDIRKRALFWAADAGLTTAQLDALYMDFSERELREHLIWLISENDDAAAVDSLLNIARTDPDVDMRTKAVFWLGESDSPRAADFLLELLQAP